jgi:transcriptional regulator with XRE-family HTH domain
MNEELKKLGSRIRLIRLAAGLSQEQLADYAGLHRTYIGGIERGERNIGVFNLVQIARALRVNPSDLLIDFNESKKQ